MSVAKNKVMRFEYATMPRSKISEAPYNPRFQDDATAARLEAVLTDENIGLVEPLVMNKRTGHLVGGHQRLHRMDAIHKDVGDYEVPVAIIDVDETTEKRINVVLNNPSIQGDWDVEKLEKMFRTDVNPFAAGFDDLNLQLLFDADTILQFDDIHNPQDAELPGTPDSESVANTAEEIAKIKEARTGHKEADRESLRSDHMIVVVFDSAEQATQVMSMLKLNPSEPFVFASKFFARAKDLSLPVYEFLQKSVTSNDQ